MSYFYNVKYFKPKVVHIYHLIRFLFLNNLSNSFPFGKRKPSLELYIFKPTFAALYESGSVEFDQ